MPGNSKLVHSSSPRPSFPAHLTTSSTIRARSRDQLAFALAFPFVLAFAFDFASPLGLGSAWGGVQGSGFRGSGFRVIYIYIYIVMYVILLRTGNCRTSRVKLTKVRPSS